jgi:hypothetical protein
MPTARHFHGFKAVTAFGFCLSIAATLFLPGMAAASGPESWVLNDQPDNVSSFGYRPAASTSYNSNARSGETIFGGYGGVTGTYEVVGQNYTKNPLTVQISVIAHPVACRG